MSTRVLCFVLEVLGVKCTGNLTTCIEVCWCFCELDSWFPNIWMLNMFEMLVFVTDKWTLSLFLQNQVESVMNPASLMGFCSCNGAKSLLQGLSASSILGLSDLLKGTMEMANADWTKNLTVTISLNISLYTTLYFLEGYTIYWFPFGYVQISEIFWFTCFGQYCIYSCTFTFLHLDLIYYHWTLTYS